MFSFFAPALQTCCLSRRDFRGLSQSRSISCSCRQASNLTRGFGFLLFNFKDNNTFSCSAIDPSSSSSAAVIIRRRRSAGGRYTPHLFHFGSSLTLLQSVQGSGRCARQGLQLRVRVWRIMVACGVQHLHVTRHTSHVIHHTSHVTHHTSHVTRHTS